MCKRDYFCRQAGRPDPKANTKLRLALQKARGANVPADVIDRNNEGVAVQEESLEMIPKITVACDQETRDVNQALIDFLENLDDVDAVFHNMEDDTNFNK